MSTRKHPLVTDEIYHIYNRSVAQIPIFRNTHEHNLYLKLIDYYRFFNTPSRYSFYSRLPDFQRNEIFDSLNKENKVKVEIYSFTLMPNHYHILAKQVGENGISNFIRHIQDSYAKYINQKSKRYGALFQSPFKAVRIETNEHFIHVARYIHLNPLTSYILKKEKDLYAYPWNSWIDYMSNTPRTFINAKLLLGLVKRNQLVNFTFDQLDYQRRLENIKHLTLE